MTEKSASSITALEDGLRFEAMLADLSSRFVNLAPGEVDRVIEEAQRLVCEYLDLDVLALWRPIPGKACTPDGTTHGRNDNDRGRAGLLGVREYPASPSPG